MKFGWRALPVTLLLGSCVGSLVSIPLLLWQRRRDPKGEAPSLAKTAVPFGPFLAVGALIYLVCLHGRDLDVVGLTLLHWLGIETG